MDSLKSPIMFYDGDCGFCKHWVEKWRKVTGEEVIYEPYQKGIAAYPQITEEECRKAVQLILTDNSVLSGAHAVFKLLALGKKHTYCLWLYEYVPFFGVLAEFAYQLIARIRGRLSLLYGERKCEI